MHPATMAPGDGGLKLGRSLAAHLRRYRDAAEAFVQGPATPLDIVGRDGFSVAFRRGSADERVIEQSFERDIFFEAVPDYRPRETDVILDVGAHIGTFSMVAARRVPSGKVYAVEANRDSFNYLSVNLALNGIHNVEANHLALADRDGIVRLHHDARGNWGHSITARLSSRGEDVAAQTLQTFMAARAIEAVSLAKFNCEGAEFPILMTAPTEALRRLRLVIVLLHEDLAGGYQSEGLVRRLRDCGFSIALEKMRKRRGWLIGKLNA
jgi:FkbM family methyltransferase